MKQKTLKDILKELKQKGYEVTKTNVYFNGSLCYKISNFSSLYTAAGLKMAYYEGEFI